MILVQQPGPGCPVAKIHITAGSGFTREYMIRACTSGVRKQKTATDEVTVILIPAFMVNFFSVQRLR